MTEMRVAEQAGSRSQVQRVHHMVLPVVNLQAASEFWIELLGGEAIPGTRNRLRVADIIVELVEAESGWTGPAVEYPHYGFRFEPEDMGPMRDQLRAHEVPTGEIWTRHQVEGLMYFRDPSGNLLETACWQGLTYADRLPLSRALGGDYLTDLVALNYSWHPPAEPDLDQIVRPTRLDHLSLPARDMAQTARFWVNVMNAELGRAPTHMVVIGGIDISFSAASGGWTAPDVDYPRYAFAVAPEHLLPMKDQIESFGIPTHDICTSDGRDAWMYVRDPSGNLFELYCEDGFSGPVRRTIAAGGDYRVDVSSLVYDDWKDPGH